MKVYQLIYTSVQHSLSDNVLDLTNQSGLRVYSCSQGITKDNIGEILKFSSYRLPKNDKTVYSGVDFQGKPGNFFAHALVFD